MFKKLIIFLSFFFISAIPAFASTCNVTTNPSNVSPNTDTPVTITVEDPNLVTNFNYAFPSTLGSFSSFTQPSWASSCTNDTSNIGCNVGGTLYPTYDLQTVVNIPSDQTLNVHTDTGDCSTTITASNSITPTPTPTPPPSPTCTVSVSPSSIPANTNTSVTITPVSSSIYIANVNYAFPSTLGSFSSFTQPSSALDCTNYSSNIGCNYNGGTNYALTSVVNIPSNQTIHVHMGVGDDCETQLNAVFPPTVGTITAPSSPVLINTAITASASFTDADVSDTHTASWNWGDGNTTTGTVTESNGSGSVSNTHTYTATGVYLVTLTVTDNTGLQGTSTFQYIAVYDANTSFAGGRSFDNPSSASPNTTGKVSFGISSKYNSSNVLTGTVKMNFKAASIDFASNSLSSLATSNGKAYLKGSGTVNGSGSYTFLASGIDGSVVGGNDLIRFQIKDSSNTVVYDSQPGAGDTADPTTSDATGNIRVH